MAHWFCRDAEAKDQELSSLNNGDLSSHSLEARSLKSRCWQGLLPLKSLERVAYWLFQLLVVPRGPWLVDTSLPSSLSSHSVLSVCLYIISPLSLCPNFPVL